jgi:hypothetical protein
MASPPLNRAPVLQEGRKSANIHVNPGFIWGIPAKMTNLWRVVGTRVGHGAQNF